MAKVTRILHSSGLNRSKYLALREQARRLGRIRSEVWQLFGSVGGAHLTDRQIRNRWLKEKRQFDVLANAWKETLRDTIANIRANREAAKVLARKAIHHRTKDEEERKRLYTLLRYGEWTEDPYLRRLMRTYWRRGKNRTHNQIVVRADNYRIFHIGGKVWISIPGLVRRQRAAIPLNTRVVPTSTLRVIVRDDGEVEIHYQIEEEIRDDCGDEEVGVDKGYSEVFTDSDGDIHGIGLGGELRAESDYLKTKYQRRSKIRAVRDKALAAGDPAKARRIEHNNLGRQKLERRGRRKRQIIRDIIFRATHSLVHKAKVIAAEDLSWQTKQRGKKPKAVNRRLAAWTKGCIAEALESVSRRRGSTVVLVNASYTSQADPRTGLLTATRRWDWLYCHDGVVFDVDEAAALNVLDRLYDAEIHLYTPAREVRRILMERAQRHRLGLLNLDSSPARLIAERRANCFSGNQW